MRSRLRARLAWLTALVLAAGVFGLVAPPSAFAAACSGSGNYFDGLQDNDYTNTYVEGSSANFTVRGTTKCTGGTNTYETSWANVAAPNSNFSYAQVGYWNAPTGVLQAFAQDSYSDSGSCLAGCVATSVGTTSITNGSTYHFWVQFVPGCTCYKENVNTTTVQQSTFNPLLKWNLPFRPSFKDEVLYATDNQFGTSGTVRNSV